MNRQLALTLALLLPLLGLGGGWAYTHAKAQEGVEWEVPIRGYDPRDLLRGHYVIFNYDWPNLDIGDGQLVQEQALCLDGTPPVIRRTYRPAGRPCAYPVQAKGAYGDPEGGLASGRLYVSEGEGRRLEDKLRDPKLQGVVRLRVRADGHITPLTLTFRQRPPEPPRTP